MDKRHNYYNQRFYAIFRRDESGKLLGYTEHSFWMGWDENSVRIWPESAFTRGFFGDKASVDKWMNRSDYLLVRVNSKRCPVNIEFDEITKDMSKFQFRNKKFTIKS